MKDYLRAEPMESTLSKDISDLLYHYDCVIVPSLGGFVTNYRPARLDKDLDLFHPPSKEVSFNRQLDKNDGILAHAISKAESVTHEEANSMIKSEVESYFSALDRGGRVVFGKVGILYLDREKNVQFSPDESVNYLLDSYGLKKVHAVPVAPKEVREVERPVIVSAPPPLPKIETRASVPVDRPEPVVAPSLTSGEPDLSKESESAPVVAMNSRVNESSRRRAWYWVAALIPLLLIIGVLGYQNGLMPKGADNLGELDPFKDTVTSTYQERDSRLQVEVEVMPPMVTDTTVEWHRPTEEAASAEKMSPAIVEDQVSSAEAVNTYVAPAKISQQEFHIIAGCFSIEENAQTMVDRLRAKGFSSNILDKKKGLYRVTYGSYGTRSEALVDLKAVKRNNDSAAWLLRKR